MRLIVNGLTGAPAETTVPPANIGSQCRGERNGCFKYDYSWEQTDATLTLTFNTRILISQNLSAAELQEVREHESHHYQDFFRLARQLQNAISRALGANRDPDMDNRLVWFDYDVCEAGAAFHRSAGRIPAICIPPGGARPM